MEMTKRHHINPCFWTALWNKEYYNEFLAGRNKKPRDQKVYSLEVSAKRILYKKTKDIHLQEGLGLAFANYNDLLTLNHVRWTNSDFKDLKQDTQFIIDFEGHFSMLEEVGGYAQLLEVIRLGYIPNDKLRIHLASFLVIHQLRSHWFINTSAKFHEENHGIRSRLMAFKDVKEIITNGQYLLNLIGPLLEGKWTLYVTSDFKFPLNDLPVHFENKKTFAILSPKMYLEVDESKPYPGRVIYKKWLSPFKYHSIKNRIIKNTSISIISHDKKILEKWHKSKIWKNQLHIVK
jgi:hypothetical protein